MSVSLAAFKISLLVGNLTAGHENLLPTLFLYFKL